MDIPAANITIAMIAITINKPKNDTININVIKKASASGALIYVDTHNESS